MTQSHVICERRYHMPASTLWVVVRDFCGKWHPAINSIEAEQDSSVRRFTVHGETTIYTERLIYFSDADRTMTYIHLQGIRDVDSYIGEIIVHADSPDTCRITWTAQVSASGFRADEIAEGTKHIFDAGLEALADLKNHHSRIQGSGKNAIVFTSTLHRPGPLCLFLHGIGGNRSNWDLQLYASAPLLTSAAIDLRGYGDSSLGPAPSTVDDYCDDILRVMEGLGKQRAVLCGLSYGSWIATSFAMRFPEKVAGLVLSGGCTGMSEASVEERETFRTSREVPLAAGKTPADFARSIVDTIAGPQAEPELREYLRKTMAAIPVETYRDALLCFTSPHEHFDFAKLTMPVLLVTGEHDRLASPSEIRGIARRIVAESSSPDVRFEIISKAGHVCNVEAPDEYNARLVEFLKRILT